MSVGVLGRQGKEKRRVGGGGFERRLRIRDLEVENF